MCVLIILKNSENNGTEEIGFDNPTPGPFSAVALWSTTCMAVTYSLTLLSPSYRQGGSTTAVRAGCEGHRDTLHKHATGNINVINMISSGCINKTGTSKTKTVMKEAALPTL